MAKSIPKNYIPSITQQFKLPQKNSHKGQNGKVLVIGGSKLFHSSVIWSAHAASIVADMVHFASTKENGEIMTRTKSAFLNGIVVSQKNIPDYALEDDVILIGPGMMRGGIKQSGFETFKDICTMTDEPSFTYALTDFLTQNFQDKKFVIDAGSLQLMNKNWLKRLKHPAIVTPHAKEFELLFGSHLPDSEKDIITLIEETAREYSCVILLKKITDYISDGKQTILIKGGNAGLAKGGTGDTLAGLTAAFYAMNGPVESAAMASYLLKAASEDLFEDKGLLYNTSEIIDQIGRTAKFVFDF